MAKLISISWYGRQLLKRLGIIDDRASHKPPLSTEELLQAVKQRLEYFKHHAQVQPLFIPEMDAVAAINIILDNKRADLSREDVVIIVKKINKVIAGEHYNGAGWYDYQMGLSAYLQRLGFQLEWEQRKPWRLL